MSGKLKIEITDPGQVMNLPDHSCRIRVSIAQVDEHYLSNLRKVIGPDESLNIIMDQLQIAHRPHDARHTFATMMAKAKADKLCVKRIIGHA